MRFLSAYQLERAVIALCPEIGERIAANAALRERSEEHLWGELACCLLSSQVPYRLAESFSTALAAAGCLPPRPNNALEDLGWEQQVSSILSTPILVDGRPRRYRFPNVRAKQLARARRQIVLCGQSLLEITYAARSATDTRNFLMTLVPGLGPKQTSMYLRNTGVSLNLAILDRHVLRYMNIIDVTSLSPPTLTMALYSKLEKLWQDYSTRLGYPSGYVDWAAWIVMRAARQERYL